MKTVLLTAATLLACTLAMGQKLKENKVPQSVKKSFRKTFPTATPATWENEHDNYEAHFKIQNLVISALLAPAGNLIETEFEVEQKTVPPAVLKYATVNYRHSKIVSTSKIVDADNKVSYKARIKGKGLLFDHLGNFQKEVND
jgi:hypothetical protein